MIYTNIFIVGEFGRRGLSVAAIELAASPMYFALGGQARIWGVDAWDC